MDIRGLFSLLRPSGQWRNIKNQTLIVHGGGFSDFLAMIWDPTSCDLILGDCPRLLKALDSFLECMKSNSVHLIFVFDGVSEPLKERRQEKIE